MMCPPACAGPFGAVVMTCGVLCWLRDIPALLRAVRARLVAGGRYVLVDGHPMAGMLADDPVADGWRLHGDSYFFRQEPDHCESPTSYVGDTLLAHTVCYEWSHPVGEVTQAVLDAGMSLRVLREEPYGFYRRFSCMTRRSDGYWELPPGAPHAPMLLALMATR